MYLIVASAADANAAALAARWPIGKASVLTPLDLSMPGWVYRPGNVTDGRCVANNAGLPMNGIAGVVSRLRWIVEQELPYVAEEDRSYVASEMNAFLMSWLSEIPCPVVNRATSTSLCGPGWRQERWMKVASRSGFRVNSGDPPSIRFGQKPASGPSVEARRAITVIGGKVLGAGASRLESCAKRLARDADVEALRIHLDADDAVLGVEACFEFAGQDLESGLFDYFEASRPGKRRREA